MVAVAVSALMLASCALPPGSGPDSERAESAEGDGPFAGWAQRTFPGKPATRYRIEPVSDLPGEAVALRTEANRSASMFFRRLDPAAAQPGRVSFGWKVERLPDAASLADRSTEDSAVRVILAFDGDHARLPLRDRLVFELAHAVTGETPPFAMLMYVWDVTAEPGAIIPSNSTGRIRKIVLDGASTPLNRWHLHQRDIAADFQLAYGEPPGPLIGVGVMSDADNTDSRVLAWYAPVRLLPLPGTAVTDVRALQAASSPVSPSP